VSGSRNVLVTLLVIALGAIGISRFQPDLAREVHKVKQRDDVFLLPPPAELRAMTLGYNAAATDLLWAKMILEYGVHWQEKRNFPDVTRYIDGILAIEPDYQTLYLYVDTVLIWTYKGATEQDARTARAYLERGTKERPYDAEVWLHYGQFIAFLAPSFLKDEAEIDAWRKEGALAIMKSVELGADAQRSLGAGAILRNAGERDATVRFFNRAYAMADDPETRAQILRKLAVLNQGSSDAETAISSVERECRARWGFLTRGECLLIGPERQPPACAGPLSWERRECPTNWQRFIDR
jgi:hypothetical protein